MGMFLIGSLIYAQQNSTGNSAASKDWYRGGNIAANAGLGGTNNIFGTMWNSPIYTYTAGMNRVLVNGNLYQLTTLPPLWGMV